MKPNNPFITIGYFGPEYFCDRKAETEKLLSSVKNDSNVTLMAPRRYGKTGLIYNLFHFLPKEYIPVYLDVYSTKNLADFAKAFAGAVTSAGDSSIEKAGKAVAQFFKSCRPTITPQESGLPKFSFDLASSQAEPTLKDAFEYLKNRDRRMVIAIDEFQQICEYPEGGTEALLRSLVQEVPWVRFVFAGSRHHLMGEMFLSAKHPFYNSTDILSLRTIGRDAYAAFAEKFFLADGKPFNRDAFFALYDRFDGVTWYVQRMLKELWNSSGGLVSDSQIDETVDELVVDRELTFADMLGSQNEVSKKLLYAIARERALQEPNSADFLARYSLSASSVRSALADLVDRDIVYRSERGYIVYDRLLGEWLRR